MVKLLVLLFAYFLGSIPTAYILARYKGFDIRQKGSGNVGTTNAFRTMGVGPGILVLAIDVLKGAIPVIVGRKVGGDWLAAVAGLVAMAGHSWSVFLSFQGGRGVATAAGGFLALSPEALLCAVLVWLSVLFTTKYVSLSSVISAASAPFLVLLLQPSPGHFLFALVAGIIIVYRHKPNIKRILAGTEPKVWQKSKT
ncbi:MAG: glycerol-3-phosphate 1-O-acyltransferase PlsY [Moorellaceae bacterium]